MNEKQARQLQEALHRFGVAAVVQRFTGGYGVKMVSEYDAAIAIFPSVDGCTKLRVFDKSRKDHPSQNWMLIEAGREIQADEGYEVEAGLTKLDEQDRIEAAPDHDDHDGSGTGEGARALAQMRADMEHDGPAEQNSPAGW